MIPKVIHYCWFGRNPLPELALRCIASWRKFLPDYEIKEWNEDNFDVNVTQYTAEAYKAKKYAFVSDYARFWILYNYGGVYFDTDVEVIRPMGDIIERGAFMGLEKRTGTPIKAPQANPGLGLGCAPGLGLYKELLDHYKNIHFLSKDGQMNMTTIVEYTTDALIRKGLRKANSIQHIAGITIYPDDYFCPMDMDGNLTITENTYSIHHYMASWGTKNPIKLFFKKLKKKVIRIMPVKITNYILAVKKKHRENKNNEKYNY